MPICRNYSIETCWLPVRIKDSTKFWHMCVGLCFFFLPVYCNNVINFKHFANKSTVFKSVQFFHSVYLMEKHSEVGNI